MVEAACLHFHLLCLVVLQFFSLHWPSEHRHHLQDFDTMPLVKIDMIKNVRTPEQIKKLADTVQEVLLDKFAAPPRDRYQVGEASYLVLPVVCANRLPFLKRCQRSSHSMSRMR